MDLDSTLKRKPQQSKAKKWLMAAAIGVSALGALMMYQWATPTVVAASQLQIATVEQADFVVKIRGFGRLKPKYQRYLTNTDTAMVEAIHVYPGTIVKKDTVILSLVNPQQAQRLSVARLELARQKASVNEQRINQQSELLERQANLAILKSELQSAELRVDAESKLIEQGIVSSLDYKRSMLNVAHLTERVSIEQQRLAQLKEMHLQRSKIQQELLSQFELNYQVEQRAFDQLQITAGIDGMLQVIEKRAQHLLDFVASYSAFAKLPPAQKQAISSEQLNTRLSAIFPELVINSSEELHVNADLGQLEQALINLIKNAFEAGSNSAPSLTWSRQGDNLNIEISDQGCGIQNPDNLFVPFYSTKANGTGIGLVITRELVRNQGFELSINSKPQQGTQATITVPS